MNNFIAQVEITKFVHQSLAVNRSRWSVQLVGVCFAQCKAGGEHSAILLDAH